MRGNIVVLKMDVPKDNGEIFTSLDSQYYLEEYAENREAMIIRSGLPLLYFNSKEEIQAVVDELAAKAQDSYIYPVQYVKDPKMMIRLGLWPTSIHVGGLWAVEWLNGMSTDLLNFWNGSHTSSEIARLHHETRWVYRTLESWKKIAIQSVNSLPLLLYAPELVYKDSKRPKTDMSLFRSPSSLTIEGGVGRDKEIVVNGENWRVIPVTRYAAGMSGSFYYDDEGEAEEREEYCGTFYYYETGSTTYLAYKTFLVAFNKTDAAMKLGIKTDINDEQLEKHMNGEYPRDLMLTPREVSVMYEDEEYHRKYSSVINAKEQVPFYAGMYLELYAIEDELDQPLCIAAKEQGYDIVILESMIGSHQVVTEVLDTRSREDSFKSLVYVV